MTLSELRYLVAVADLRHFGHAAERCHITQSTLSIQLRKLEDFLGVSLVERTSRHINITPIGQLIVVRARRILEEADQICDLARQDEGLLASGLKLGVIPTVSPYPFPLFLDDLHRAYPQLRLILHEDLTANLIEALAAYEVDVLLLALPQEIHGLHAQPLFDEQFWWRFPPVIRWARRPSSPSMILATANCYCSRRAIACASKRWRSADNDRGKIRRFRMCCMPAASKRFARWSRPGWAARCCRRLPFLVWRSADRAWRRGPSRHRGRIAASVCCGARLSRGARTWWRSGVSFRSGCRQASAPLADRLPRKRLPRKRLPRVGASLPDRWGWVAV